MYTHEHPNAHKHTHTRARILRAGTDRVPAVGRTMDEVLEYVYNGDTSAPIVWEALVRDAKEGKPFVTPLVSRGRRVAV